MKNPQLDVPLDPCHACSDAKSAHAILEKLDTVQNARRIAIQAVSSVETVELTIVQQVMREMGAKGGKIGGKRRMETMTDEQRKRSAPVEAAKARWAKAKKNRLNSLFLPFVPLVYAKAVSYTQVMANVISMAKKVAVITALVERVFCSVHVAHDWRFQRRYPPLA